MTDRTGSENRLYPLAERLDEGLLTRAQAVLEDVARRRTAISYSELGDAVPGVGRRGRKIGAVLEVLGRRSLAQHGALITVLSSTREVACQATASMTFFAISGRNCRGTRRRSRATNASASTARTR